MVAQLLLLKRIEIISLVRGFFLENPIEEDELKYQFLKTILLQTSILTKEPSILTVITLTLSDFCKKNLTNKETKILCTIFFL